MTPARLEAWLTRGLAALSVALVSLLLLVSDGQMVSQDLPAQVEGDHRGLKDLRDRLVRRGQARS